jgi:hypothetical protein
MIINLYESWSKIFLKEESIIFLEDDVHPSKSFFYYCEELLEYYKFDNRVSMICGMNHFGDDSVENAHDYFFSRGGSIWGFAIWKRTFESFDFNLNDKYTLNYLINRFRYLTPCWVSEYVNRRLKRALKNSLSQNEKFAFEFQYALSMLKFSQYQIIPTKNMIKCDGLVYGGDHTPSNYNLLPKSIQKLFNLAAYDISLPLKHPNFLIYDDLYRIRVDKLFYRHSIISRFYLLLEYFFRYLIYAGPIIMIKKIHKKIFKSL